MPDKLKPYAVEAVQWNGNNHDEVNEFIGLTDNNQTFDHFYSGGGVVIKTLKGNMWAGIGDYIIKGVNGEYYPCEPDIFEKIYSSPALEHFADISKMINSDKPQTETNKGETMICKLCGQKLKTITLNTEIIMNHEGHNASCPASHTYPISVSEYCKMNTLEYVNYLKEEKLSRIELFQDDIKTLGEIASQEGERLLTGIKPTWKIK